MVGDVVVAREHAAPVGADAQVFEQTFLRRRSRHAFDVGVERSRAQTLRVEFHGVVGARSRDGAIRAARRRSRRAIFLPEKHQRPERRNARRGRADDVADPVDVMRGFREQHRRRLAFAPPVPAHERVRETPVPDRLQVLHGNDLPDCSRVEQRLEHARELRVAQHVADGKNYAAAGDGLDQAAAAVEIGRERLFQQDVVFFFGESERRLEVHAVLRGDDDRVRELRARGELPPVRRGVLRGNVVHFRDASAKKFARLGDGDDFRLLGHFPQETGINRAAAAAADDDDGRFSAHREKNGGNAKPCSRRRGCGDFSAGTISVRICRRRPRKLS